MFKLGIDDDLDLEEDFFQDVFTTKSQKNHVRPSTTCIEPALNSSHNRNVLTPRATISVLTPRNDNIIGKTTDATLGVKDNDRVKKPATNRLEDISTDEMESLLDDTDDIDWDQCFPEDTHGDKEKAIDSCVNKTCDDVSTINKEFRPSSTTSTASPVTPVSSIIGRGHSYSSSGCGRSGTPNSVVSSGRKRRFPGPAGLLPTQQNSSFTLDAFHLDILTSDDKNDPTKLKEMSDSFLSSQISENPFESEPWIHMQSDLDLNGKDSDVIKQYNIAWVLCKAASKQLPNGKVPVLILIIKSILEKGTEASVVFKDETGEMPGTIHRKVFEDYEDSLLPGAVLVVKNVSIFSPTSRKHYLSVTPTNMVCLYSPNPKRSRLMAEGVNNPKLQIREYALEPWITTESCSSRAPLSSASIGGRNVQPTVVQKTYPSLLRLKVPDNASTKQISPVCPRAPVLANTKLHNNVEDDAVIPDDDLDKLFEDLDNDIY